jgi:hypothetical protein
MISEEQLIEELEPLADEDMAELEALFASDAYKETVSRLKELRKKFSEVSPIQAHLRVLVDVFPRLENSLSWVRHWKANRAASLEAVENMKKMQEAPPITPAEGG